MVEPSSRLFSASDLRELMKDPNEFVDRINKGIIDAAKCGNNECYFDISDKTELGKMFWRYPVQYVNHFEKIRGFVVKNSQSVLEISWSD